MNRKKTIVKVKVGEFYSEWTLEHWIQRIEINGEVIFEEYEPYWRAKYKLTNSSDPEEIRKDVERILRRYFGIRPEDVELHISFY